MVKTYVWGNVWIKKESKKGDCGDADRCVKKNQTKVALCISIFNPLFYLSESALMRPHAWVPTEQSWQKADVEKKKKKKEKKQLSIPWLSLHGSLLLLSAIVKGSSGLVIALMNII